MVQISINHTYKVLQLDWYLDVNNFKIYYTIGVSIGRFLSNHGRLEV